MSVPRFTKDDLELMDAEKPSHPFMTLVGKLTLHYVSPFLLSNEQASSLDAFMASPWPQNGGEVVDSFEGLEEQLGSLLASAGGPTPLLLLGTMRVMGTYTAGVWFKLSQLPSSENISISDFPWNFISYPTKESDFGRAIRNSLTMGKTWSESFLSACVYGRSDGNLNLPELAEEYQVWVVSHKVILKSSGHALDTSTSFSESPRSSSSSEGVTPSCPTWPNMTAVVRASSAVPERGQGTSTLWGWLQTFAATDPAAGTQVDSELPSDKALEEEIAKSMLTYI
jgi:hypothetical protein